MCAVHQFKKAMQPSPAEPQNAALTVLAEQTILNLIFVVARNMLPVVCVLVI